MNSITLPSPLAQSFVLADNDPTINNNKLPESLGVTVSRNAGQDNVLGINQHRASLDKPSPLVNTTSLSSAEETFKALSLLMQGNQNTTQDVLAKAGDMFIQFLTSSFKNGAGLPKDLGKGAEYGVGGAFIALAASSVDSFEIELAKTTTELEKAQNKLKGEEIKRVRSENEAQMKDNQAKIKESEEAAQDAKKQVFLGKYLVI